MLTSGVLAIVRLRAHEPVDDLLDALVGGGVQVVEVTLPTPGSLDAVRRWAGRSDVAVGVGTVRTPDGVAAAVDAGARFLVTPTLRPAVLEEARRRDVPTVCGATTPSEIDTAWDLGAAAVKVFPVAALGGPSYVRAVQEPLDDVPLLPTGGVTVEDTREYARLGCVGVGVGGALVPEAAVARRSWQEVADGARRLVAAWEEGLAGRHG